MGVKRRVRRFGEARRYGEAQGGLALRAKIRMIFSTTPRAAIGLRIIEHTTAWRSSWRSNKKYAVSESERRRRQQVHCDSRGALTLGISYEAAIERREEAA